MGQVLVKYKIVFYVGHHYDYKKSLWVEKKKRMNQSREVSNVITMP